MNRRLSGSEASPRKVSLLFRFDLQQVLNYRRQREESKEFEFAEARRVMQQEEARLAFFKDRRDRYQRELVERQKQGVTPAEVAIYNAYRLFIEEKIENQMEAVETARKQLEKKTEELMEARKDRKILDRLRSRKHDAYLIDSRRREMKQLDELAIGKFHRRTQGGRG